MWNDQIFFLKKDKIEIGAEIVASVSNSVLKLQIVTVILTYYFKKLY
jgi:hypothetical protein